MVDINRPSHVQIDCGLNEIRHPAELGMEKQVGELLVKLFPHVSWYVEADFEQGILNVELPDYHRVGNKDYGYTCILDRIKGWDDLKRIVTKFGGELLERAHISTTRDYRYADKVDRD